LTQISDSSTSDTLSSFEPVTVTWGDGTQSQTSVVGPEIPGQVGIFEVIFPQHSYATTGTFNVAATGATQSGASCTATATVYVGEVDVANTCAISLAGSTATVTVPFTDPAPPLNQQGPGLAPLVITPALTVKSGDPLPVIDWGEGTPTTGVYESLGSCMIDGFSEPCGEVVGLHTYATSGPHTVTTFFADAGGQFFTSTCTATTP
jgi:hypothetical protein